VLAGGLGWLAFAHGPVGLAGAWVLLGVGMALGLYDSAFATLTALYGLEARAPITGITLIAGFASTVGWPLSALLNESFGWRGACLGWAALNLFVCLPMNRLLIPRLAGPVRSAAVEEGAPVPANGMMVLAFVFGAVGFGAARLAAIPAGAGPANKRSPVHVVVISSGSEGDQTAGSLDVKALWGRGDLVRSVKGGRATWQAVA